MIKLQRSEPPHQLTEEKKQQFRKKYKDTSKNVWSKKYIREALSKMSSNKCAYCECKLGEESKYVEIEHFFPKHIYPELVVEWDNLLPSCKRCNGKSAKGTHDTGKEPIIDPTKIDPKEHLKMKNYRIVGKDLLGKTTSKVLYLNDTKISFKRFEIGQAIENETEDLYDEIVNKKDIKENSNLVRRIIQKITSLLEEALPEAEYAATAATILLNDNNFINVKKFLQKEEIWDDDIQELYDKVKDISLDV